MRISSQRKNGSTVCGFRVDRIGLSVPKKTSDTCSTMTERTRTAKSYVFQRDSQTSDDLVVHINFLPSRVPVTIGWNKHLPHFDSTREDQEFKTPDGPVYILSNLTWIVRNDRVLHPWTVIFRHYGDGQIQRFFDDSAPHHDICAKMWEYKGEIPASSGW